MQRRLSEQHIILGRLLEEATHEFLPAENVSLNLEFCDLVNSTPEGPKEAAKLIRKRIQQTCLARQTSSLWYTLILLDTCVKNCGYSFQLLIMNKDYLNEIQKILMPKYNPPVHVQEKVLAMIQSWALAFRNNPDMRDAEKVYEDLKMKGVEFPSIDMAETPALMANSSRPSTQSGNQSFSSSRGSFPNSPHPASQDRGSSNRASVNSSQNPSAGQKAEMAMQKLRQDLTIVSGNVKVLKDMLTILRPENIPDDDLQLMQELNRTCRAMQTRLLKLLEESSHLLTDDTIINEMLLVNDDLNNAFLRYDRFEKCRLAATNEPPQQSSSSAAVVQDNRPRGPSEVALISFEESPAPPPFSARPSNDESSTAQSSGAVNQLGPANKNFLPGIPDTQKDLNEMEKWMKTNEFPSTSRSSITQSQFSPVSSSNSTPPRSTQHSTLSSEEFDKFLDAQMQANPELRNSRTKPLPSLPARPDESNLIKFD